MNTKRCFYILTLVALFQLAITSCSKDNDLMPPGKAVSSVSFADQDPDEGLISGTLKWVNPDSETNIDKYIIYVSSRATEKEHRVSEVPRGQNSYEIPVGTPYKHYIVIVAANEAGESGAIASLEIEDYVLKAPVIPPLQGAYILNNGNFGSNDATLDFLDFSKQSIAHGVFRTAENRKLGDTGQDMIAYGNKLYIAVYGSKTIEVTDLDGNSIIQKTPEGQPRTIVPHGKYVYITLYNGYVMRMDTASYEMSELIKVGSNPDQMVVANGRLYISNTGGMSYPNYDKTVSVIDIPTFKETKKLDVALNPAAMVTSDNGDVYLTSLGDYSQPPVFQRIDAKTDEVTVIENVHVSEMTSNGKKIFYFHLGYDENFNSVPTYGSYDMVDKKPVEGSFLKDDAGLKNPYKIFIDRETENLYITTSDYKTNGEVRFYFSGQFMQKWETGLNPIKMVFVDRK